MSGSIERHEKDYVMQQLLSCKGNVTCVLIMLDCLGLNGCDFTLSEIGEVLHVTRERVRQIEASAIKKLKHPKMGRVIKAYLES